jgi:uncharacterized membrane protein YbaN (DUF454 family)
MTVGNSRAKQVDSSRWALVLVAVAIGVFLYFVLPMWALGIYVIIVLVAMVYFWSRGGRRT